MVGDYTMHNIVDPNGRKVRLLQRRSTDFREIAALHMNNDYIIGQD